MLRKIHSFCTVCSNQETEVHAGSAFCRRCKWFNGLLKREGVISCLRHEA